MAKIEKFEDIEVWKKARILDNKIFSLVKEFPSLAKDFKLKDQMLASSGSIMDNIAEGFERGGNKEFRQFLSISKGSSGELRSQLYRSLDRKYISAEKFEDCYSLSNEIGKMIKGFMDYLKESDLKGIKYR